MDFPVCRAILNAPDDVGYAAVYGWVQTVLERPLLPQTNPDPHMDCKTENFRLVFLVAVSRFRIYVVPLYV